MSRNIVITLSLLALAAAGCTSEQEKQMQLEERAEQVAAGARTHLDALAREVGTDPEVTQDEITACVPGQRDSGLDLIYNIHVQTEPGAMDRVLTDVAPRYEADGWAVRQRGDNNVVFERDNITMGALFSTDGARATVSGTGGCVR
jgi:hypothetical protein